MMPSVNSHNGAIDHTTTKNNTSHNSTSNIHSNNKTLPHSVTPLGLRLDSPTLNTNSHDVSQHYNAANKTVQEIVEREDEEANMTTAGRCCITIFLPILLFILITGTLLGVVYTSGGSPEVAGVPRAVLFIVEGFKGTTFTTLLEQQRLPHLRRMLVEQEGIYAMCTTMQDARCARVALVEDDITGESYISAGAGVANILTGVSPRRHRVRNDSWNAFHVFAETSTQFPSVAMRATRAGLRVLGLGGSHLLNALTPTTGECGQPGILDAECDTESAAAALLTKEEKEEKTEGKTEERKTKTERSEGYGSPIMSCLHQHSCNLFRRVLTLSSSSRDGKEERQYTQQLLDIFGGLFSEGHDGGTSAGNNFDNSLLIFHFNALAQRAGDADLPEFTYEEDSLEYAAQAFLIDSLIGQILTFVRDRASAKKENWLIVGTSDHGGSGKSFGNSGDADEVIPFFLATYTSNSRGYTKLQPLQRPVTHMDAAPTILKWLGLPPYEDDDDDEDEDEEEKKENVLSTLFGGVNSDRKRMQHSSSSSSSSSSSNNNNHNNHNDDASYEKMASGMHIPQRSTRETVTSPLTSALLDGRLQGICGSGLRPKDCST